MFAYKTTSGSAPLYLNSLLQTYVPSRSLRSASERRIIVPSQRGTKSLSLTFSLTVPSWWPAQLNPSSWVLRHLQETAKNTSIPSLFEPLTLLLSILILFYLSVFFLFKKNPHTFDPLLHIYFLTASFSWKTNTSFIFFYSIYLFLKKKKKNTLGFFFLYSIYSFL